MKHLLAQLVAGQTLSLEQTVEAFELIMTGQASAAQMGALLALMQARGPSVEEIAGAARVMRQKATPVEVPAGLTAVDTCGTGGDHAGTFNVSTAAALVVAGAGRSRGVVVAKHGNRSVTSKSGSSQVLECLGVKLQVSGATLTRCLAEAGFCFCFAPLHHPAMKHAVPVRGELGFRTIFNLLGPLTNPAGARRQVVGVFLPELTEPIAQVLARLGSEQVMVVHGRLREGGAESGVDEISTCGPTRISHLRQGAIRTYELDPGSLGLTPGQPSVWRVDGPEASAELIRRILSGERSPARELVCLNAAAALVVTDLAKDLQEGLALAAEAIDSGQASGALAKLVEITQAE